MTTSLNLDLHFVASFGDEWQRFDHQGMAPEEPESVFGDYFAVSLWHQLPPHAELMPKGSTWAAAHPAGPALWHPA